MRPTPRRIRTKLAADSPALGVTLQLPSPEAAEIAGYAGLDFVWIDAEHGTMTLADINAMVRAADAGGLDAIVRVPDHSASFIQRVLDIGASGIIAPHIRSLDEARAIVAATKYPPEGIRGACPSVRAVGHLAPDWPTERQRAQSDVMAFGLIEDLEGVENVEAIAAESGLYGLLFGSFDLAMELGLDGDVTHPKIQAMGARVLTAARRANIEYLGLPDWGGGSIESLAGQGVRIFNVSGDRGGLFTLFSAGRTAAEKALATIGAVSQA